MKPKQTETYKLVIANKKDGIRLLYENYGRKLYGYGISTWKLNEDETWELVYKTLYRVLETTRDYKFESEQKYGSFIFKIFINYLRNHYRDTKKQKERVIVSIEDYSKKEYANNNSIGFTDQEPDTEKETSNMILLKSELEKLDEWEKVLLLLRSQDMPYDEIAKYVNKPANQLKVYYQRLKATLMQRMNDRIKIKKEN